MFPKLLSVNFLLFCLAVVADLLGIIQFFKVPDWSGKSKLAFLALLVGISGALYYGSFTINLTEGKESVGAPLNITQAVISTEEPVATTASPQSSPTSDDNMLDSYSKGQAAYEKQDYGTAFPYFMEAAKLGYAPAEYAVGECYRLGAGTKANGEKAFYWYNLAAEQNDACGLLWTGYCYHKGIGVKQDYTKARDYYLAAEIAGHKNANDRLAELEADAAK